MRPRIQPSQQQQSCQTFARKANLLLQHHLINVDKSSGSQPWLTWCLLLWPLCPGKGTWWSLSKEAWVKDCLCACDDIAWTSKAGAHTRRQEKITDSNSHIAWMHALVQTQAVPVDFCTQATLIYTCKCTGTGISAYRLTQLFTHILSNSAAHSSKLKFCFAGMPTRCSTRVLAGSLQQHSFYPRQYIIATQWKTPQC